MKSIEKVKARTLRAAGKSVKAIAKELQVSQSSVSHWVRDIELTDEQHAALAAKGRHYGAQAKGALKNKQLAIARRTAFRQAGYELAKHDASFRVICALYWGEGSKTRGNACIANCDTDLLRIWGAWLVSAGFDAQLGFRVQYYAGMSEDAIWDWWRTRLPFLDARHRRKFTLCTANRASQQKYAGKLPYGTASISVSSVELLERLLGGIDYLRTISLTG